MKIYLLTVGFLFIAGFALAADIDGKWSGQYDNGMGEPMTLVYTFKADGNTLTGTSLDGPDATTPIKDGKIDGKNISFVVVVDFGGQEMKFNYKGVLSGDQIELSFEIAGAPPMEGGPPQKFVVKRVK
jgi:hypothetical protein